jgi:hypothetical protein
MTVDHLLDRAMRRWAAGLPISLTLASALMALGLDVETLERKHRI